MLRPVVLVLLAIGYHAAAIVDAKSSPAASQPRNESKTIEKKVERPAMGCDWMTFSTMIRGAHNFHAETNGDSDNTPSVYNPPVPQSLANVVGGASNAAAIENLLMQAFNLAPRQAMKNRLCELKYILIDDTAMEPYAFWESAAQEAIAQHNDPTHTSSWTFIGIPVTYFTSKPLFSHYEADVTKSILVKSGVDLNVTVTVTPQSPNVSDNFPLTLVGILAHELGHILQHHFALAPSPCRDNGTPLQYYTWWSFSSPPPSFHTFATTVGGNFPSDPNIDQIIADVNMAQTTAAKVTAAANDLTPVYTNGNFPSLFANTAPDEDFAEAFKWHILLHPGTALLQQATISYDTDLQHHRKSADIVANYAQSGNNRKMKCMEWAESH